MDTKHLVLTHPLDPGDINDAQANAANQMTSTARHALEGCIFGLTPTAAQTGVTAGEAYIGGNRLRLRAERAIALAGITRPASSMVAWVSVQASYATEGAGTVTDEMGVQHVFETNDGIVINLVRGVDAANQADAVKPPIPSGSIVLCDILLDENTAIGSLTGDPSRRPKCPDDRLQDQIDQLFTLADVPEKNGAPSATSTVSLRIDATWPAGTVGGGVPAVTSYRLRWRQAGEDWTGARTLTLGNVLAAMFSVPNDDLDIEMQVSAGNSNGFGEWSDTGTIDAGDIEAPPALMDHEYTTAGSHALTWPYPQATRARLTIVGGEGGGGGGGAAGGGGGASGPQGIGGPGGMGPSAADDGDDGDDGAANQSAAGGNGGGVLGGAGAASMATPLEWNGGGGGGGGEGEMGEESSVTVAALDVDETAAGGPGGGGGGGGGTAIGNVPDTSGDDGDDAGNGAGGDGGAGGAQAYATDNSGGDGGDGAAGTTRIVDISGLTVGAVLMIEVGDGGDGGGGATGGTDTNQATPPAARAGSAGSAGDAGSVTIEPLAD